MRQALTGVFLVLALFAFVLPQGICIRQLLGMGCIDASICLNPGKKCCVQSVGMDQTAWTESSLPLGSGQSQICICTPHVPCLQPSDENLLVTAGDQLLPVAISSPARSMIDRSIASTLAERYAPEPSGSEPQRGSRMVRRI